MTEQENSFEQIYKNSVIICTAILASSFMLVVIIEFLKTTLTLTEPAMTGEQLKIIKYVFYAIVIATAGTVQILRQKLLSGPKEITKLLRTTIITTALCESIIFYGFALFMIGRSPQDFYLFAAICIIMQIAYFPKKHNWQRWLEEKV